MTEWLASWQRLSAQSGGVIDVGDRMVCLRSERGRGKAGRAGLEIHGRSVYTVPERLITHMVAYPRREKTLEAAVH
jgi:hypothetical protein